MLNSEFANSRFSLHASPRQPARRQAGGRPIAGSCSARGRRRTLRGRAAAGGRDRATGCRALSERSGSSGATSRPPPVFSTISVNEPRRGCTTGTPLAMASSSDRPLVRRRWPARTARRGRAGTRSCRRGRRRRDRRSRRRRRPAPASAGPPRDTASARLRDTRPPRGAGRAPPMPSRGASAG